MLPSPLDMGEEDIEEHIQGHTKEGPWGIWARLEAQGFARQDGNHCHNSNKGCTLIIHHLIRVINSGEGNQAQVCAPSSHPTKANPSGSTAFSKGKCDQRDLQRVESPGLIPTIRARRCWNSPV